MQLIKIYDVINVEDSIELKHVDTIKIEYSLNSKYGLRNFIFGTFSYLKFSCDSVLLLTFNKNGLPILIKGFNNLEVNLINDHIWLHTFRAALLCNYIGYYIIYYSKTNNIMAHIANYKKLDRGFKLLDLVLIDYFVISGDSIISMRDRYGKKN